MSYVLNLLIWIIMLMMIRNRRAVYPHPGREKRGGKEKNEKEEKREKKINY